MYYETIKDYLNDQFRLPLLNAIKNNDIKEAVELIDFFYYKFEETNAFSKGQEEYCKENGVEINMPILEFVKKYVDKYMSKKEWNECSTALSDNELNVKELNELWDNTKKEIEEDEEKELCE